MEVETSSAYRQLLDKIHWSQAHGYGVFHIAEDDVALGRLFAYAFRTQTVGAFRAARMILELEMASAPVRRAVDLLRGLEELSLMPVPADFRAVVATVAAYARGLRLAIEALNDVPRSEFGERLAAVRDAFVSNVNKVTGSNGIWVASDLELPEQATFKVPGISVVIVPLVYGDYHSWNNALVVAGSIGQTTHRHQQGVEIHLGYQPLHGRTLLGDHATTLHEGYAMPIPPLVDHGFDNLSDDDHLVPFIFGSLRLGGWGIFADVEPRIRPFDAFAETALDAEPMNGSVYIERAIANATRWRKSKRQVLIGPERTATSVTGGLELGLARVMSDADWSGDTYRILSVRNGRGRLRLGQVEVALSKHDHVGIPAGIAARLEPIGDEPLVLLDATIVSQGA